MVTKMQQGINCGSVSETRSNSLSVIGPCHHCWHLQPRRDYLSASSCTALEVAFYAGTQARTSNTFCAGLGPWVLEEFLQAQFHQIEPTIGLALGGGFARGVAHIGVIKILEKEHIPIGFVAGTSVGALVGAAYCSGVSVAELEQIADRVRFKDFAHWKVRAMVSLATSR